MKLWCRRCKADRQVPSERLGVPAATVCTVCGSSLVSILHRDRPKRQGKRSATESRPTALSSKPRQRIWIPAREKVELEDICRLAPMGGCEGRLEAAHVIGRDRDHFPPLDPRLLEEWLHADARGRWLVAPDRIVPLCRRHHRLYDRGLVGLLGRLYLAEELQAVSDSHTGGTKESGLELARVRIEAPAYARAA